MFAFRFGAWYNGGRNEGKVSDMKREAAWTRRRIETPLGAVWLEADADGVTALRFEAAGDELCETGPDSPFIGRTREQLAAYFAGTRREFDVPLSPAGTPFQMAVWRELLKIPFGGTRTYGQLASALGRPGAARAVGAACGRNPLAILVPCHRVVGADGSLTGYAWGVERKQALLALEGAR